MSTEITKTKQTTKKTKQTTTESARLKTKKSPKKAIHFSAEQGKKFQRRSEGFNIADPVYLQWLKINHPSEEQNTDSFLQFQDDSQQNTELEDLIQQRLESDQEGLSRVEIISDEEWSQDEMVFNESARMPNVSVYFSRV